MGSNEWEGLRLLSWPYSELREASTGVRRRTSEALRDPLALALFKVTTRGHKFISNYSHIISHGTTLTAAPQ